MPAGILPRAVVALVSVVVGAVSGRDRDRSLAAAAILLLSALVTAVAVFRRSIMVAALVCIPPPASMAAWPAALA
eukprot:CAMPEP_0178715498 /NCGR_PEP_ID=MMETSP0699-20121125/20705_1 /TAXON_ID=265572 /ORGANISM="Extubocellulus spinifer, Strain CCMP396" /LENGTH=74 /DNA_ID=CAMNT_0020364835 /DNA_START=230 /DNA_END=451 /DNA_ORIENTATION=+